MFWPLFNRIVMNWPHVYEFFRHENLQELLIGMSAHYWWPINYLQTYIVGIMIAYLVRHKPNIYLGGRIGELFIWITTAFISFGLMYWQRNFVVANYPFEALNGYELHIYLLVHKLIYLPWFAWLIFACCTGRGGLHLK